MTTLDKIKNFMDLQKDLLPEIIKRVNKQIEHEDEGDDFIKNKNVNYFLVKKINSEYVEIFIDHMYDCSYYVPTETFSMTLKEVDAYYKKLVDEEEKKYAAEEERLRLKEIENLEKRLQSLKNLGPNRTRAENNV